MRVLKREKSNASSRSAGGSGGDPQKGRGVRRLVKGGEEKRSKTLGKRSLVGLKKVGSQHAIFDKGKGGGRVLTNG